MIRPVNRFGPRDNGQGIVDNGKPVPSAPLSTVNSPLSTGDALAITSVGVARLLGLSKSQAQRLLVQLQADGLRRKGCGRGTHYDRDEFLRAWRKMDTRQ